MKVASMMQRANGIGNVQLSICIPTYNRLKYLKELLPGLIAQIDAAQEGAVELVVSDNVSTDGTADYLKAIKRDYFRFWTNESNVGRTGIF